VRRFNDSGLELLVKVRAAGAGYARHHASLWLLPPADPLGCGQPRRHRACCCWLQVLVKDVDSNMPSNVLPPPPHVLLQTLVKDVDSKEMQVVMMELYKETRALGGTVNASLS